MNRDRNEIHIDGPTVTKENPTVAPSQPTHTREKISGLPWTSRQLTVDAEGGGGDGVSGLIDGLAHVHAGVLGDHRHDVQRDEAEVVCLLDARA